MRIQGKHYRTIAICDDGWRVSVIDQRRLPFELAMATLASVDDAAVAIRDMAVRGAPLIGVTAAYGIALAMHADPSDANLHSAATSLAATRPTAVNLRWALRRMQAALQTLPQSRRASCAYREALAIADEDVANCNAIGQHGLPLLQQAAAGKSGQPVNVLTHCNAGWLACVDWGTALAPIYAAHDSGVPVHVYVDETRPRSQGALLTTYELAAHGVPHTLITDNAGGHLMQHGKVDLCIVGCDRLTSNGDVANKIGTYLKALAARDNGLPFYVALPFSTIDWSLTDGVREIEIESRATTEVTRITGRDRAGTISDVDLVPETTPVENPAFDVTPARLITALITERGRASATSQGLRELYPEIPH